MVLRLNKRRGWDRELARVLLQLETPRLTRDQVNALGARLRGLNLKATRRDIRDRNALVKRLEKAARDLERRLGGQQGGVVRRDDAPAFSVPAHPGPYTQ